MQKCAVTRVKYARVQSLSLSKKLEIFRIVKEHMLANVKKRGKKKILKVKEKEDKENKKGLMEGKRPLTLSLLSAPQFLTVPATPLHLIYEHNL